MNYDFCVSTNMCVCTLVNETQYLQCKITAAPKACNVSTAPSFGDYFTTIFGCGMTVLARGCALLSANGKIG